MDSIWGSYFRRLVMVISTIAVSFMLAVSAYAGCTSCAAIDGDAYCVQGNVAELCQTVNGGCNFSGSRSCGQGCFLPGMQILTNQGNIPISLIQPGDMVCSRDANGNEKWVPVIHTYQALRVGYYVINGALCITEDHPLLIGNEWKPASEVMIGDVMVDEWGHSVTVVSIDWIDRGVRVFNIDVLTPDNFFAAGYLVHNKDPLPTEP